jgi:hydrogenase expression/formation protein HypE
MAIGLSFGSVCPISDTQDTSVLLFHSSESNLTQRLIEKKVISCYGTEYLTTLHDGATFSRDGIRLALSADSFVVKPNFPPGGNGGELATNGTVKDLAMCGATPLFLSAALFLEKGFPTDQHWRMTQSKRRAVDRAGSCLSRHRHLHGLAHVRALVPGISA